MYSKLYARSFGKNQQKKLALMALVACFVMVLSFCALFNAYSNGPITILNFQRNVGDGALGTAKTYRLQTGCKCNFSHPRTEFCEVNGDVRIDGNSSTIFVPPSVLHGARSSNESVLKVRPYARKIDGYIMSKVRKFSMGSPSSLGLGEMPQCSISHKIPAIVFSSGGYTGNFFHDFNDVLIPLYITSRHFNGDVQFLIADLRPKWLKKHETLLSSLSTHKIIDIDNTNEVHCFPSMIVGLKSHIELGIDPFQPPQGYTMRNFTAFVRKSYSLKRSNVARMINGGFRSKPRLLIISRTTTRMMVNDDEVAAEARSLGFDVAVLHAGRELRDFSKTVNSFDVMVGVHGAGLTNSIFLPENGVLVQIVPVGLEWLAKVDFEMPASAMGLSYLDYKVSWKESSLSDKYEAEDPFIRKLSIKSHGFVAFKRVYLDGQNVRIDVGRFRATLLKALHLLRRR